MYMYWNNLFGKNRVDIGLLVLRLALAIVFLYHGGTKFMKMAAIIAFFATLGLPAFMAYAIAILEVGVGVLMLIGVMTNIAAWYIVIEMIGTIALVHWQNGFAWTQNGYEFPLVLILIAVAVAHLGSGTISLAHTMGNAPFPMETETGVAMGAPTHGT